MKIVKQDKKEGIVTLVPETLDDLWHLSHIVEVGDSVSSKTTRRIQDNTGDKLRSDRGVKKTFTLKKNNKFTRLTRDNFYYNTEIKTVLNKNKIIKD